jgi:hypothetical protein
VYKDFFMQKTVIFAVAACLLCVSGCISSTLPPEEQVFLPVTGQGANSPTFEHALLQAQIQVDALIRPPLYPIRNNGKILLRLPDLSSDSYPEVFVLCVKTSSPEMADYAVLANYARLKNKPQAMARFYLACFKNVAGTLVPTAQTDLGEKPVFRSFTLSSFSTAQSGYTLIRIEFYTTEGSEIELFLVGNVDLVPVHIATAAETMASSLDISDIDDDTIFDIVISRKQAEDAVGYETIMRWYRFNGEKYTLYGTFAVVQRLQTFLQTIKKYMLKGQVSSLVSYAVSPSAAGALREKGSSDSRIAARALGLMPVVSQSGLSTYNFFKGIKEIVFPDIIENPFIHKNSLGLYFKLTFKIIDTHDVAYISEIPVYLNKNPFGAHPFLIYP